MNTLHLLTVYVLLLVQLQCISSYRIVVWNILRCGIHVRNGPQRIVQHLMDLKADLVLLQVRF